MRKEETGYGKTVEEAIQDGLRKLGVTADKAGYEIVAQPKKGFLGIGERLAEVKVFCGKDEQDKAVAFIETLIENMGLKAKAVSTKKADDEKLITIEGEQAGLLIGHHGDTLDAIQYLANLATVRGDEDTDKAKVTVDIEGYRSKREETLRNLARRMAEKAKRTHRSVALEPMNPYERRIIHSEIQQIQGVSTHSVGEDDNRKIIITVDRKQK